MASWGLGAFIRLLSAIMNTCLDQTRRLLRGEEIIYLRKKCYFTTILGLYFWWSGSLFGLYFMKYWVSRLSGLFFGVKRYLIAESRVSIETLLAIWVSFRFFYERSLFSTLQAYERIECP